MVSVGIVGASGYIGGELLRILVNHPDVEVGLVTSRQNAGKRVTRTHPNLKGFTNLVYSKDSPVDAAGKVDLIFLAVPHGKSVQTTPEIVESGTKVIDLSADFRLKNAEDYPLWYGWEHPYPDLLSKFVYGLPELHGPEIARSSMVAVPGCIASSAIYSLAPLAAADMISGPVIVDAKVGSSGSGSKVSESSNFSERYNSVRIYSPTGHRHIGEIEQELSFVSGQKIKATMSAHSVNMVRGILTTSSTFQEEKVEESKLWKIYRSFYRNMRFVRFIMDQAGIYKYPDPKVVIGSNFIDLGFATDEHVNRTVAIGALDNLIKGAAGNAVQSMNLMLGLEESAGLLSAPLRLV